MKVADFLLEKETKTLFPQTIEGQNFIKDFLSDEETKKFDNDEAIEEFKQWINDFSLTLEEF